MGHALTEGPVRLFDEVAINPECLCDDGVLYALRHSFGWSQGRLVSAVPVNWSERVKQIANTLPDGLQKARIKDICSQLALIPLRMDTPKRGPWLEVITELHRRQPFSGIIAHEPPNEPGWFSPDQMDDYIDQSEARVGHFEITHQSAAEIVRALTGFLRVNKRLVLVNAYQWFYQNRQSTELFEEMMKEWVKSGGVSFRIVRSKRQNEFDRYWPSERDRLDAFLRSEKFKGEFMFIAVQDDSQRLHERFLIGSVCGLELGYGLETSSKPQAWKLLRQSSYSRVKQTFMDQDIRDAYADQVTWRFAEQRR